MEINACFNVLEFVNSSILQSVQSKKRCNDITSSFSVVFNQICFNEKKFSPGSKNNPDLQRLQCDFEVWINASKFCWVMLPAAANISHTLTPLKQSVQAGSVIDSLACRSRAVSIPAESRQQLARSFGLIQRLLVSNEGGVQTKYFVSHWWETSTDKCSHQQPHQTQTSPVEAQYKLAWNQSGWAHQDWRAQNRPELSFFVDKQRFLFTLTQKLMKWSIFQRSLTDHVMTPQIYLLASSRPRPPFRDPWDQTSWLSC